jgi:hypothetical protein
MPVDLKHVVWSGGAFYAALAGAKNLILARWCWDGSWDHTLVLGKTEQSLTTPHVLLAADPLRDDRLLVHVVGNTTPFADQVFPATDRFPNEVRVQRMPAGTVGASRTAHGITWLLVSQDIHFTLMAQRGDGELIATYTVPFPKQWPAEEEDLPVAPVPLHARGEAVYVGLEDTMLVYHRVGEPEIVKFERPIVSLAGSWPNTRTRIAVGFAQGGTLYWRDFEGGHMESFSSEMHRPVVGLNRGGYLIAASRNECEVYSTQDGRLELVAKFRTLHYEPIAVLPGPRTGQFAIAHAYPHGPSEIIMYDI